MSDKINCLEMLIKRKQKDDAVDRVKNIYSKTDVSVEGKYMSVVKRYSLEVLLCSGSTVVRNIIAKSLPTSEPSLTYVKDLKIFKNEIQVYTALRKMKTLMEEFQDKRETLWCEMIGYRPYDELYLEDLQDLQYYVMDRCDTLDWEHNVLVIKSLARFHAMSRILIKKSLINPDEFGPGLLENRELSELMLRRWMINMEHVVRTTWGEKWQPLADLIKKANEVMHALIKSLSVLDINKFNVLNLGDCWNNNLMFKHIEGTNIPCGLKFIDLQLGHYNSFAWDLTYFIYTSISPKIRRDNFDDILQIYHDSLTNELQFYKYPVSEIPSIKMIIEEMERVNFSGFVVLCSMYPWVITDLDDTFDFTAVLQNVYKPEVGMNAGIFSSTKYRSLVEEDFLYYMSNGLMEFLEKFSATKGSDDCF